MPHRIRSFDSTAVAALLSALGPLLFVPPALGQSAASAPVATAADCGAAATQAAINLCAESEFSEAGAAYASSYRKLHDDLPPARHAALRRMQKAWLAYRTEACRFESGAAAGGSAQGSVYWACAARLTRQRSTELLRIADCVEGDIGCSRARP